MNQRRNKTINSNSRDKQIPAFFIRNKQIEEQPSHKEYFDSYNILNIFYSAAKKMSENSYFHSNHLSENSEMNCQKI